MISFWVTFLSAVIAPVKFKIPLGVAASVIKPKLLFPLKLKMPLFTILLLLFKVVFTVICFADSFVNTLPLARVKIFCSIVPELVKSLFNVKVPEPLIVPALDVLPLMIKADVLAIVPLLVKVSFNVIVFVDVNVLPDATDKMF